MQASEKPAHEERFPAANLRGPLWVQRGDLRRNACPRARRAETAPARALGDAMGEIRGYNAPEVQEVYSRAQAMLDDSAALREQLFVLSGRFNAASVSAKHHTARQIAEQ